MSTPASNERYLEVLQALAKTPLRFAVFGSAALLLRYPELRAKHQLRDADLLLPRASLPAFAAFIHARGGNVTAWNEPWTPELDVTGRFYVRASLDGLQLDATFETFLDLEAALGGATSCDGVPVCSDEVVWRAKFNKDADAARAFAAEYGLTIPSRL